MNLNPENAQKLAGVLLDRGGDDEAAEPGRGRLAPGAFGRYRITGLVGVGGMGEVYEAQQENPARRVAIKVLRPELVSGEALRRFEHETRILGRLEHPGIASIFEAGQVETPTGRMPFFAMEFVDGKPLTSFAADAKLPLRARLELFLKVCEAVEHAHRKGVIHRDLKPGNILVDAGGRARVMDFGVARATDSDVRATTLHTEMGRLVGTLPYMSPEQVGGDPDALDTRSDVYSLGVILYELLGGRLPYELKGEGRGRIPEAVRTIQESEPAPLSSVNKAFRGDLDTIVGKALAKERDRRYQSVGDLAGDIRRYLDDEPIVARRPSSWYQLGKFAKRNKAVVALVIVVVLVFAAGAAMSTGFALQERQAKRTAQKLAGEATARQAEAERQVALAKAVLEFLEDTIAAAAPDEKGRDVRVADVMDVAVKQLADSPFKEATVEAAVREAIATAYRGIGRNRDAVVQLRRAYELREADQGRDHPDTIVSMLSLAAVVASSRDGDPMPLLTDALERSLRTRGEDWVETQRCRRQIASELVAQGRSREAIEVLERLLQTQRSSLGPQHEDTLRTLGALASAMEDLGDVPGAERLRREQLAARTALLGERHPDVLRSRNLLARTLQIGGKLEEAETLARGTAALAAEVLGDDHPETLVYRTGLAFIFRKERKLKEAEEIQRPLIASMERVNGADHPDTLLAKVQLGAILRDQDQLLEAISLFAEALQKEEQTIGEEDPQTLNTMDRLAGALAAHKEFDRAEPLARRVLELTTRVSGPDHPNTLLSMNTLAKVLREAGKLSEAADQWSAAVAVAERVLPPDHEYVSGFKTSYGRCLTDLGRYEEAEKEFSEAYDLVKQSSAMPPDYRATAVLDGFIALYEKWGRGADVAKYRALRGPH